MVDAGIATKQEDYTVEMEINWTVSNMMMHAVVCAQQ